MLYQAQSIYSNEYFISHKIKYVHGLLYLLVKNTWRECDELTLSNLPEELKD